MMTASLPRPGRSFDLTNAVAALTKKSRDWKRRSLPPTPSAAIDLPFDEGLKKDARAS